MEFEDYKEQHAGRIDVKSAFIGRLKDDPPLLQELGIDFGTIKKESRLVLKTLQGEPLDLSFIENADVSGPIVFVTLYTLGLAFNCKMHFGYIYLISLLTTISMYFLLNVLDTKPISFLGCCSVLGYAFLPVVFFSFLNIFIAKVSIGFRIIFGFLVAFWSSYSASMAFCKYLSLTGKRFVIGYPIVLAYMCFVMIVLF